MSVGNGVGFTTAEAQAPSCCSDEDPSQAAEETTEYTIVMTRVRYGRENLSLTNTSGPRAVVCMTLNIQRYLLLNIIVYTHDPTPPFLYEMHQTLKHERATEPYMFFASDLKLRC